MDEITEHAESVETDAEYATDCIMAANLIIDDESKSNDDKAEQMIKEAKAGVRKYSLLI